MMESIAAASMSMSQAQFAAYSVSISKKHPTYQSAEPRTGRWGCFSRSVPA